ncbi:unnamed protein product [Periconia digitata]|uniref:Choline dehydrogenase n=1 Tax=Periconia digitata TaxID=1303443 RepID=A0A9W4UTT9_9PLEO|nr:unnamed protein product [Periconia digitata]
MLGATLNLAASFCLLAVAPVSALPPPPPPPGSDCPPKGPNDYDYVVVGSGPGGLTIARRLAEDPDVSVAVVEAGPWSETATDTQSQIPAFDFFYGGKDPADTNPAVEWGFVTTPQKGNNDRSTHYARGKSVGGSSNLNYMAYAHTNQGALSKWASDVGDSAFEYSNAQRLYRKSVHMWAPDNTKRFANATPQYDFTPDAPNAGGPLDVGYANYGQPFATWIAKAMQASGIANVPSFVNGKLMGSAYITATIDPRNAHRDSSATAFGNPPISNLKILNGTLAERVLFNAEKKATGVRVSPAANANSTYTLNASKEVIISGGVFQSPQLLLLSGIGPKDTLDKYSIPVVADRPGVGQNLLDHVYFGVSYRVNVQTTSSLQYGNTSADANSQWATNASGLLSSPGGDYFAFEKVPESLRTSFAEQTLTELAALPSDWPEIQYVSLPAFAGNLESSSAGSPPDGYQYATLLAALNAPSSVGNVSISSSNPRDQPLINPNWLTTQRDIDLVTAGFKRLRQIFGSPAIAPITIGPEYFPGSEANVQTDTQIHEQIKRSFQTMFHAAASNKMGKSSDKNAVVDSSGRVYGVSGLRVVDASAFPFLPPGLPQATVYMLAEKVAEDMKGGR